MFCYVYECCWTDLTLVKIVSQSKKQSVGLLYTQKTTFKSLKDSRKEIHEKYTVYMSIPFSFKNLGQRGRPGRKNMSSFYIALSGTEFQYIKSSMCTESMKNLDAFEVTCDYTGLGKTRWFSSMHLKSYTIMGQFN